MEDASPKDSFVKKEKFWSVNTLYFTKDPRNTDKKTDQTPSGVGNS
jgi:hypothetical protein